MSDSRAKFDAFYNRHGKDPSCSYDHVTNEYSTGGKFHPQQREWEIWQASEQSRQAEIDALKQRIADAEKQEPVAYVMQSLRDGSIGGYIAPVGYTTFPERMEHLKQDPWAVAGAASVIPLYALPPIPPDVAEVDVGTLCEALQFYADGRHYSSGLHPELLECGAIAGKALAAVRARKEGL